MIDTKVLLGKKILVTGGTGFIGSHIVDRCLELGAKEVIAFDNLIASNIENINQCKKDSRFRLIRGDIRDMDVIAPLIKQTDIVFHNAASKMVVSLDKPRIDLESNIIGTFNILEAARGTNARIIHASTGSVLGSSDSPMLEDHARNPASLYGISKTAAESYVQFYAKELGVKASVLRYFHVYGPRQDYSHEAGVISIFLERVLSGKPPIIFSGGAQIRCFTYVSDVVSANILLVSKPESIGKTYNIASKVRMSINELANFVIKKYSAKPLKAKKGKWRIGENYNPIPNISKIEKLGFVEKISFEEGVELTKKYVEQQLNR